MHILKYNNQPYYSLGEFLMDNEIKGSNMKIISYLNNIPKNDHIRLPLKRNDGRYYTYTITKLYEGKL